MTISGTNQRPVLARYELATSEFSDVVCRFDPLCLAGACYHLRAVTLRPTPPISPSGMPEEDAYSDDIDYLGEDKDALEALLFITTKVFKEWSLNVNESKTEFVHIYIAGKDEVMDNGKPLRMNEEWFMV